MSEIYKASIRSTIGKPQVLCVTQGQAKQSFKIGILGLAADVIGNND